MSTDEQDLITSEDKGGRVVKRKWIWKGDHHTSETGEVVIDTPVTFEDSSFESGDSPITLDINENLGRASTQGYLICDGDGNISVQFSTDGETFGNSHTVKANEVLKFSDISVNSVKITHSGTNSAYRSSFV